jgi:hypothetical protein
VYSVAGRSSGRVMLCAVCTVHEETRSVGFLVEPQNQGRWFVSDLASKPLERFLPAWPQNQWRWFLPLWPQNRWQRFLSVWPQNRWLQVFDLGLKTGGYNLVIWASKSPQQFLSLGLKTKRATVYQLRHKIDGRMKTTWGTHRDLVACFA